MNVILCHFAFKVESSKKRPAEAATPVSAKKAKSAATPQKTGLSLVIHMKVCNIIYHLMPLYLFSTSF